MSQTPVFVFVAVCIYLGQYSAEATLFRCNRTAACGCSVNNADINARIVGGEIAASHSWGWAASLNRATSRGICGGAIISRYYVLTAAHCVNDDAFRPGLFSVIVGKDSLNVAGGQQINVSRILVHPKYNTVTLENDIALLYLNRPINLQDENVGKICLPAVGMSQQVYYPVDKKPVVAIGWGRTSSGGSASSSLRQVTVNVVNNKDDTCKVIIKNSNLQFCAAVRGGGKDTCQGDSGGPLMYYSQDQQLWILAGVTSYGRGCGLPDSAGVYTRVSAYTEWIQSIVKTDGSVTIPQNAAGMGGISPLFVGLLLVSCLFLKQT